MRLQIEFLGGAGADLQEIFNRLKDLGDGFGCRLTAVVDAYLAWLIVFLEIAPVYLEKIRRQVIRKFPCAIFYEVQPTRILLRAILDLRQDQHQILRRLRG